MLFVLVLLVLRLFRLLGIVRCAELTGLARPDASGDGACWREVDRAVVVGVFVVRQLAERSCSHVKASKRGGRDRRGTFPVSSK
jgi:hypothetical protein